MNIQNSFFRRTWRERIHPVQRFQTRNSSCLNSWAWTRSWCYSSPKPSWQRCRKRRLIHPFMPLSFLSRESPVSSLLLYKSFSLFGRCWVLMLLPRRYEQRPGACAFLYTLRQIYPERSWRSPRSSRDRSLIIGFGSPPLFCRRLIMTFTVSTRFWDPRGHHFWISSSSTPPRNMDRVIKHLSNRWVFWP